ncbi:MAG: helix-turn-helix domain-containing protein [Verrucomicrobia bacterium]|nr:helix-turn-helix domain-containing protein [Verrucomicrobiota bacterium]MCH8511341.1 AraC family transcriptional regulator [Kiritimatiellia bacterium]
MTEFLPARRDLQLLNVGHLVPATFWKTSRSFHRCHELIYVTAGTYRVQLDDGVRTLKPGTFILYPEGCMHEPLLDSEPLPRFFLLQWKESAAPEHDLRALIFQDDSKRILTLITWIWERHPAESPEFQEALRSLLHAILFEMHLLTVQTESAMIDKVRVHVRRNLTGALTLEELAEVAGKNKFHFTRLFSETTGFTPMKYVQKVRVDTALSLLLNTDLTMKDITRRVGYENPFTLSNLIKREQGLSPREIRKRHREKEPQRD